MTPYLLISTDSCLENECLPILNYEYIYHILVYYCPVLAVTNYYKLGTLKQQKFIPLTIPEAKRPKSVSRPRKSRCLQAHFLQRL